MTWKFFLKKWNLSLSVTDKYFFMKLYFTCWGIRKNRVMNGRSNFENSRFFIFQMREKTRKIYISIMNLNFPYLFCTRFPRSEAIKRAANYYKFFQSFFTLFFYIPCWLYLVMVLFVVLTNFGLTQIIVKARLTFHQHFCL